MNAPSAFVVSLFEILYRLIGLYIWCIVFGAVLSWLIALNMVNPRNRFVATVGDFLHRITEPALRPLRRYIPPVNGLDLSPLALIAILWFLQLFIFHMMVG